MEIILWRHAQANDNFQNDLDRTLTKKGHLQAKIIANWLKKNLNFDYKIFTSEAKRTQETAKYLSENFYIEKSLNPNYSDLEILKFIFSKKLEKNIIIVGHQPWIGNLCYKLLQQNDNQNIINNITPVSKSSIWWFQIELLETWIKPKLKIVITPNFLIPK